MVQARETSGEAKFRFGSLEIGRFIAAIAVMLSHVVPYANGHAVNPGQRLFGGLLFPGPLGVQYFFVLSGFVMASAHIGDFGRLAAAPMFWWRRACRIYPTYWLALCIPAYYLLGAMTPGLTLHLMLLDPWHDKEYIPAAWTLRYEMAFYIMFGLCLLPYIGKPLLVAWVALTFWHCVDPTLRLLHPRASMPFYWFIHYHASCFVSYLEFYFFGGLAAGVAFAKWRPGRRTSIALLAISCAVFLAILPVEDWGRSYSLMPLFMLLMAIVIGGNILGLALLERHGVIRLGKYAAWAGAMSYPIYLFHEPVLLLVINRTFPWGLHHMLSLYVRCGAMIAVILVVAALVTFLYDQPVQRALRRLTRRLEGKRAFPPGPALADLTNEARAARD